MKYGITLDLVGSPMLRSHGVESHFIGRTEYVDGVGEWTILTSCLLRFTPEMPSCQHELMGVPLLASTSTELHLCKVLKCSSIEDVRATHNSHLTTCDERYPFSYWGFQPGARTSDLLSSAFNSLVLIKGHSPSPAPINSTYTSL
ncbi:Uncharacterized protein HZ326_10314 [Fusarium oxysporum f. sp. albedinis]|nr:Uncharacterized protein HZ326_10314 [Fusarium oxysporum f. sp. albedinis]